MGSPKIYWPRRLILKLLEELQKYELLYNMEHPLYHNATAKNDAYLLILLTLKKYCPEFEGGVSDIKTKMKNLRTQYRKEMRSCMKAAQRGVRVYEPKLYCFSQIDFLRKYNMTGTLDLNNIKIITCEDNMALPDPVPLQLSAPKQYDSEDEFEDNDESVDNIDVDSNDSESNSIAHVSENNSTCSIVQPSSKNTPVNAKINNSAVESDTSVNSAMQIASSVLQRLSREVKKNELDISFAKYVRQEMMAIESQKIRSEMRDRIIGVIFEYKRKELCKSFESS